MTRLWILVILSVWIWRWINIQSPSRSCLLRLFIFVVFCWFSWDMTSVFLILSEWIHIFQYKITILFIVRHTPSKIYGTLTRTRRKLSRHFKLYAFRKPENPCTATLSRVSRVCLCHFLYANCWCPIIGLLLMFYARHGKCGLHAYPLKNSFDFWLDKLAFVNVKIGKMWCNIRKYDYSACWPY